jgi:hypothetical protein
MLNPRDLKKIENIKQFVADQGITNLDVDILLSKNDPRVYMYFTLPSSQGHGELQALSEGPH